MDHIGSLVILLVAVSALLLAYSSVPKIRRLENRVEEVERKIGESGFSDSEP
jgi:hypothetical protein